MHVESLEQEMRFVTHALSQALELGFVEVVLEDGSVFGMCALFDDLSCALARRHAADVGEALVRRIFWSAWWVAFCFFLSPVFWIEENTHDFCHDNV